MPQKTEDVHSRKHLAQITDALQCIEACALLPAPRVKLLKQFLCHTVMWMSAVEGWSAWGACFAGAFVISQSNKRLSRIETVSISPCCQRGNWSQPAPLQTGTNGARRMLA
jgi:hypothetical protein